MSTIKDNSIAKYKDEKPYVVIFREFQHLNAIVFIGQWLIGTIQVA
jgi:hypothetical protein